MVGLGSKGNRTLVLKRRGESDETDFGSKGNHTWVLKIGSKGNHSWVLKSKGENELIY